jgi:hypothetical protein
MSQRQKVAQRVAFLGYFIFSKSYKIDPKVAQLVKNYPIWSPCQQLNVLYNAITAEN